MKVLQVLAGAAYGGAEAAFEDIVLALSDAGLNQKIITRNNNPERVSKLRAAGLEVITLPFGGALDVYTSWRLKRIIAEYQPNIVQTWMSRATQKTPAAQGENRYLKVARLGGYYNLKYFKGTDYYVANTPDIRSYLIKEGIPEERTTVLNNFADVDVAASPASRSELNTPEGATVILALARYHEVKGLDILIRAAAALENVHLWLAGQGPLEDELKALAQEVGVANRVHFLGWRTDRAALLQAADMCAIPSRHEPFGSVFVQAWAQKTPVICSRCEGPSQYVHEGEDGLFFDIDNVSQLESCIKDLMDNKEKAEKLAESGYIRFQNEFSKEKITADYLGFYRDILRKEELSENKEAA